MFKFNLRRHPAPPNKLGIRHYHTSSGNPIPDDVLGVIYRDIIGPVHEVIVPQIRAKIHAMKMKGRNEMALLTIMHHCEVGQHDKCPGTTKQPCDGRGNPQDGSQVICNCECHVKKDMEGQKKPQ